MTIETIPGAVQLSVPAETGAAIERAPAGRPIPWPIWCSVAAVTSAMIGGHWDISWHRSGGRVVWESPEGPLAPKKLELLRFRVEDEKGAPASDLEPYMGMYGHAIIMRSDLGVFAHIHPTGSVSMGALALLAPRTATPTSTEAPICAAWAGRLPAPGVVAFPYGFPGPGEYRIFVQVKRRGKVETASFDARVGG